MTTISNALRGCLLPASYIIFVVCYILQVFLLKFFHKLTCMEPHFHAALFPSSYSDLCNFLPILLQTLRNQSVNQKVRMHLHPLSFIPTHRLV